MKAVIDAEVLADLVGHYTGTEHLLFRVSDNFVAQNDWKWSKPVRFRFTKSADGFAEMVITEKLWDEE